MSKPPKVVFLITMSQLDIRKSTLCVRVQISFRISKNYIYFTRLSIFDLNIFNTSF